MMFNAGLEYSILLYMNALVDTIFKSQQSNHAILLPLRYGTYNSLLVEIQMAPLSSLILYHILFLFASPTNTLYTFSHLLPAITRSVRTCPRLPQSLHFGHKFSRLHCDLRALTSSLRRLSILEALWSMSLLAVFSMIVEDLTSSAIFSSTTSHICMMIW